MKHTGKIPKAVVGELMHVINNKLNSILLNAEMIANGAPVGIRTAAIELVVLQIGEYMKSLEEKNEWDSGTFKYSTASTLYDR